ncbi:TPA: hypothetical protein ACGZ45_004942 [Escherichia coli]|nr:hypothetical protein [Escherichia coli]HAY4322439.1 hypothetical protein [Escherichia coli]HCO5404263.1 hypothetical protein [Escherichia coli]HCO7803132.1 hypothetical protein [Escherichia coli]
MRIPTGLRISLPSNSLQQVFINDGVFYVHASSSDSFEGLCIFRALLSMEEIDGTGWFHKEGLKSGERGNTVDNVYKGQPISQGVSLSYSQNYREAVNYFNYIREEAYPVLYGLSSDVKKRLSYRFMMSEPTAHPVSDGGLNIDYIVAIYVPTNKVTDAQNRLSSVPTLRKAVKSLPQNIFFKR